MTHDVLVTAAAQWLRVDRACSIVSTEIRTHATEIPDVLGWREIYSYIVECKTSRSDFLADQHKPWRKHPEQGMGMFRYYCTPPRLLHPEEVPCGWGLLEAWGNSIEPIIDPIPRYGESTAVPFARNTDGEILVLQSIIRRMAVDPANTTRFYSTPSRARQKRR